LNRKPKIEEVVIAALLHDVGKVLQRGSVIDFKTGDEHTLCPFNKSGNYFSHQHVLFTDGFLTKMEKIMPSGVRGEFVTALAAKHHKPDSPFEWILTVADWISSGADRNYKEKSDDDNNKYFEQPLKNVYSKVNFIGRDIPQPFFFDLNKLDPENIFAQKDIKLSREKYSKLAKDFVSDFEKLSGLKYKNYLSALLTMCEYYFSLIPASTIDEPDVSLFDHSTTTAAIATVLYEYHEKTNSLGDIEKIKDYSEKKFLIISGDLSGIQRYIFNLKSTKNSAKILRAKSFELQAFTESVSSSILEKCNLSEMCKLVNAGGRFILLLPNTKEIKNKLCDIRKEVENFCIQRYFGELTLNLSEGIELSANDFHQKNASIIFRKISWATSTAKQKKLQNALSKNSHIIEKEYDKIQGSENVCKTCGVRAKTSNDQCNICNSLVYVGGNIPRSSYLGFIYNQSVEQGSFNLFNNLKMRTSGDIKDLGTGVFPQRINQYEPGFPMVKIPYYLPSNDGKIKDFEELSKLSEGIDKIAMFKADLDNLGAVFSIGMGKKVSISRYATISRMTDYFFSTYLNDLLKNKFENIYTIFSGGDDLCLIGPWTEIVDFAICFQKKFNEFTGSNQSISISGGIVLSSSKVPVSSISQRAEEALEKSKKGNKNQITLFDTTVSWQDFEKLVSISNDLSNKLKTVSFSKAVVYRLIEYGERERKFKDGDTTSYNALWRSHLRYDAIRNIKNDKERDEFLYMVESNINNLKIISSYALYKNR
jgi:CRISPR-associated protein Csm1